MEEWKQKWSVIQESLSERGIACSILPSSLFSFIFLVRDDEEQRAKLQTLQRENEERLAELEHFKGKWWDGKEKVEIVLLFFMLVFFNYFPLQGGRSTESC